jgi:hypothetical protein
VRCCIERLEGNAPKNVLAVVGPIVQAYIRGVLQVFHGTGPRCG